VAAGVKDEYEAAMGRWVGDLQAAETPEAQRAVWQRRPDPQESGRRMWAELRSSLEEDWTLDYAAWLIETAPYFAVEEEDGATGLSPAETILKALEDEHLRSPKIGRLCLSLTALASPQTLELAERIADRNPDEQVQGQAAMAAAILLKKIGDERRVMQRRIERLREAIIKAADVKVGDVTVAELAEDEIYTIMHLSKGRVAPEIEGRDVAGAELKLGDFRGKVVILVFWRSVMRDAERGLAMLRELQERKKGAAVELLGVTTDAARILRHLKKNGTVTWRNFHDPEGRITRKYRVQQLPVVYVLDQEGVIQYIGGPGTFVELAVSALLEGVPEGSE